MLCGRYASGLAWHNGLVKGGMGKGYLASRLEGLAQGSEPHHGRLFFTCEWETHYCNWPAWSHPKTCTWG